MVVTTDPNITKYETLKEICDLSNYDLSRKTILIVEDDFASAFLLTEFLQNTNVKFIHVCESTEAVKICQNQLIDLVIMDNKITGTMNGIELTRRIKQYNVQIPIIGYSGDIESEKIGAFFNAGCDAFLAKPVNLEQFTKLLFKFLLNKPIT